MDEEKPSPWNAGGDPHSAVGVLPAHSMFPITKLLSPCTGSDFCAEKPHCGTACTFPALPCPEWERHKAAKPQLSLGEPWRGVSSQNGVSNHEQSYNSQQLHITNLQPALSFPVPPVNGTALQHHQQFSVFEPKEAFFLQILE